MCLGDSTNNINDTTGQQTNYKVNNLTDKIFVYLKLGWQRVLVDMT